jgi:hypothetical protein
MTAPLLYEINTRCWLRQLSDELNRPVTLANVPDSEIETWRRLGFSHLWLMGVWASGPRSRAQALADQNLRRACSEVLPGWQEEDMPGSPYSIADYQVPDGLGGEAGLAQFRRRLQAVGIKLILDFVPNHLGLDHPWVRERTDLMVQSTSEVPETFLQATAVGPRWVAYGKDPNFPAWTDTVQLDYRRAETRAAMRDLLQSLAMRCDGVRCDMAMLLLTDVFAKTWAHFPVADPAPSTEFWAESIASIKKAYPAFMVLGEAYWGLESRLLALGFDYTYDKDLYDGIVRRDTAGIHRHIYGMPAEQVMASAHFLENHDEPRIAAVLPLEEHRAAALLIAGLPGMRFLHEGQLQGARLRIPVQLGRRPIEPIQPEIAQTYQLLLSALPRSSVGTGEALLIEPREAWPGNPTAPNFIIVQWQTKPQIPQFDLVVVNLAPHRSQCFAPLTIANLDAHNWSLRDLLCEERYVRSGEDLVAHGLYLDLPAHGAQLFHCEPD